MLVCCRSIGIIINALAVTLVLASASATLASEPVPRTLTGCVSHGRFVTSDGYLIDPRSPDGSQFDLSAFEGRQVRMSGALLPGDRFIVQTRPQDLGRCQ
jgi:hypothetical protein